MLLTIDDLPLAMRDDYRSAEERRETVQTLVEVLRKRDIPVVGFFNMHDHEADPALTEQWLSLANFTAGNHAWSHQNARRLTTEKFLQEVEKGHQAVEEIAPEQEIVPFRFPFLNQGYDPEKRDAIFTKLDELQSPHVPVTINTSDWLYARGYLDALHDNDGPAAERWKQNWLWNIQEATMTAEFWAGELFGRQPPQILLLHANRLNAEHLPEALDWYRERGYRFVGLQEVLDDPAYKEADVSTSPIGESRWLRLRRARMQGENEERGEDSEDLP